jgi:pSer/pThr/pTyr-binding forkhead associated (FHA) protein
VHRPSGQRFELDLGGPAAVGRVDPVTGIQPEVDLTVLDAGRSSSRRHARLYRENGNLWLVEEIGTLNGTFVNGARIDTAVPVAVAVGDVLRFGLVELLFEA